MNSRSEEEISLIIAKNLPHVLAQKVTIDSVCLKHPDLAEILRPELEVAVLLSEHSAMVQPRAGFVRESRSRLVRRIEQEAARAPARPVAVRPAASQPKFSWLWRFSAVAVIFVMLFLSFTGTVYASSTSMPGETLYPVKRWSEDTYFAMTLDSERQVQLSLAYSSRRLQEAETLLARGQVDLLPQVMAAFELEVNRAIDTLEKEQRSTGKTNEQLLRTIQAELSVQDKKISAMLDHLQPDTSASVKRAVEAMQRSADKVDLVTQKNQPKTPTAAPTVPGNVPQDGNPGQGVGPGKDGSNTGSGKDPGKDPGNNPGNDAANPGQGKDNPGSEKEPQGKDKDKDSERNNAIPTEESSLTTDISTAEPDTSGPVKPTQASGPGNENNPGVSPPVKEKPKP
jgi:uncharacterized membrane protein YgcG